MPTIDDTDRSPSIMEGRHALLPKFCAHGNDGPGIFGIVRGRIFGPFLATKGDGKSTSICLAVSPRIAVERHGGGIRFTSEPGATRFTSEPGATRFQLRPPMDGSVGEASRSVVRSLEVGQ